MEDKILLRRIYILLAIGGLFVIFFQAVGLLMDNTTYFAWWIANFFHTVGGAYAVIFMRAIFQYRQSQNKIILPLGFEILIFIGGAIILGVFWEWYELILDRYRLFVLGIQSIASYADNIGDLAFDMLGALIVGVYLFFKSSK